MKFCTTKKPSIDHCGCGCVSCFTEREMAWVIKQRETAVLSSFHQWKVLDLVPFWMWPPPPSNSDKWRVFGLKSVRPKHVCFMSSDAGWNPGKNGTSPWNRRTNSLEPAFIGTLFGSPRKDSEVKFSAEFKQCIFLCGGEKGLNFCFWGWVGLGWVGKRRLLVVLERFLLTMQPTVYWEKIRAQSNTHCKDESWPCS